MINNKFYNSYRECTEDKRPITIRGSRTIDSNWEHVLGLIKPEYILFDIDDKTTNANLFFALKEEFEFRCHITESCNGIHAIFRTPVSTMGTNLCGNNRETVTGIIADFKHGGENERIIAYGKAHNVIEWCDEPDELPFMLFPFGRKRGLQDVTEGDGRHHIQGDLNNVLATYYTDPEIILRITNWVNSNVFLMPRKSVNWSIKDVWNSIQYVNTMRGKTIQDVLTEYKIDDMKVIDFIIRNGEKR